MPSAYTAAVPPDEIASEKTEGPWIGCATGSRSSSIPACFRRRSLWSCRARDGPVLGRRSCSRIALPGRRCRARAAHLVERVVLHREHQHLLQQCRGVGRVCRERRRAATRDGWFRRAGARAPSSDGEHGNAAANGESGRCPEPVRPDHAEASNALCDPLSRSPEPCRSHVSQTGPLWTRAAPAERRVAHGQARAG